jgi:hypothetical protein
MEGLNNYSRNGGPKDAMTNEEYAQEIMTCENRIETFRHAVSIVGREGQLGKPTLLSCLLTLIP